MRKFSLAAAAIAALAISSTQAFAADVMNTLTSKYLAGVFTSAGMKDVKVEKPAPDVEIVSYDSGNGSMTFILQGCGANGCTDLQMSYFFNKDPSFTLASVNSYNAKYLNAQAALQPDGTVTLMKLYLPGGGVTDDNVRLNIDIFLASEKVFVEHTSTQVTAALNRPIDVVSATAPVVQPRTIAVGAAAGGSFDLAKWLHNHPGQRGHSVR